MRGNMVIELHRGMVNITAKDFAYGNIRNMYKDDRDGVGLQVDTSLISKDNEILEICNDISDLLYRLQDLTEPK